MIEKATTMQVIQYLFEEIAEEESYNGEFEKAKNQAILEAQVNEEPDYLYYKYLPPEFDREPRKSVIQDNNRMIRRLMLKIRKES